MPQKQKNESLIPFFKETFTTEKDGLPGGWMVEQNTDLPHVPAIRCGENCIELLSAGNKFIAVTPDTSDSRISVTISFNYEAAECFGFCLFFRYDMFTGRGQYLRISDRSGNGEVEIDCGHTRLNQFEPVQKKTFRPDRDSFFRPLEMGLEVTGTDLKFTVFGKVFQFTVSPGSGKIAVAREHFWDSLKILAFSMDGEKTAIRGKERSFTVPLPDSLTHYPVFCDVTLKDYGNCMDAALSFHGGVAETEPGEGNYASMRADIMTRPYLKVLTEEKVEKYVVFNDEIVMVPPGIAKKYFYGVLNKKHPWPFCRTVRFFKPAGKWDLALGFESWHHNASPNLELTPAETVFTRNGKMLYSGLGITGGENIKVEFLSQEKKEIIRKLPENDPRYEQAVNFARKNHFFFEGEKARFRIVLRSVKELPVHFEIILEDAFLRPIRTLQFRQKTEKSFCGVIRCNTLEIIVEELEKLACGVYHLRFRSLDRTAEDVEDYCAFEFMSRKKNALPPPLISGLPFLYNARTETRGLITDSFDPWMNARTDEAHYVSSAVMLPPAFRQYKMGPVIKAYGRRNFAWISTRDCKDSTLEGNLDVIADSDYINIRDNNQRYNVTWIYLYTGKRFQQVIDFLKNVRDPEFDLEHLRKLQKEGGTLPLEDYRRFVVKYWEEYLDEYNRAMVEQTREMLQQIRKVNPDAQLAQYGPYPVYGSALKGHESPRVIGHADITPELSAFWQYEDYPYTCGYGLEVGLFHLTACLMAMPGSAIYPEIYTGEKLRAGIMDEAVFFSHPPFGTDDIRSEKILTRRIANFVFGSGHLTEDGFRFWEKRGFQAMRFTRRWFEAVLKIWPLVLDHAPARPLRSSAYLSSDASRRACTEIFVDKKTDVRLPAAECVPFIYQAAARSGLCCGFQLLEENIGKLSADQVDTLVLPPLKGMSSAALRQIRKLHEQGVNLVACMNVDGLEDLFGVRNTGKMKRIRKVTAAGDFCAGMSEYCDDEHCRGCYVADGAEVLLKAEIPVLTLKKNAKASAAFFNVPPHMVKGSRFGEVRCYGRNSISPLMEKAVGTLMHLLSGSGIEISSGRLLACHTRDNAVVLIVENPDDEQEMPVRITIDTRTGLSSDPETNLEITLLEENDSQRVYRALLPKGEILTMIFKEDG